MLLMSDEVMRWATSRAKTTAGQANLTLELCRLLPLPLPPLPEQHRIVAEVDRLLSIAREVEAEVDANLKRAQGLRQAIYALNEAFVDYLNFGGYLHGDWGLEFDDDPPSIATDGDSPRG